MRARWLRIPGVLAATAVPFAAALPAHAESRSYAPAAVGGEVVTAPDWLVQVIAGRGTTSCTGTVIAPRAVLTAAHCVTDGKGKVQDADAVAVSRIGTRSVRPLLQASAVEVHPQWKGAGNGLTAAQAAVDLAVIVFPTALQAPALPLATSGATVHLQGTLTGYGLTAPWSGSMPAGDASAPSRISQTVVSVDPAGTLVTFAPGVAACQGDSGSAFVTTGATGTVAGVLSAISRAPGAASCETSGAGTHAFWAPVARHADWIARVLKTSAPSTAVDSSEAPSAPSAPSTSSTPSTSARPTAGLVVGGRAVAVRDGKVQAVTVTAPAGFRGVGAAQTASGAGGWVVDGGGRVIAGGDAVFAGDLREVALAKPIVAITPTATGAGYWLVASDGGIFAFGDARFLGSTGGMSLNRPIVGMAATPTGAGYWLVASDGGIFAFGDAAFAGSTGAIALNRPINGMAPTVSGAGYWLFASDGGVFAFGDARFFGSLPGAVARPLTAVGMLASATGEGYWIVADDGTVHTFGRA